MERIAAQELADGMDVDEEDKEDETRAPSPRTRSLPLAPVERNEHGVLMARAKGKGRANYSRVPQLAARHLAINAGSSGR
ncbi:hypothetical protein FRC11_006494, partial [Ceratobasidium sp. 423]